MLRGRLPVIFSTSHKMPRLSLNLHLTQPCQCDSQKTRNTTRAPATKTATHLLETSQKYCACHTKRLSTRYKKRLNVTKCHACHAKRSNETFETSKNDPFCRTYHGYGHIAIGANGCKRLRTVANVNATSNEHTLNPQTPRVKREPLLRTGKQVCHFNQPSFFGYENQ